jgi:hypothetical protein
MKIVVALIAVAIGLVGCTTTNSGYPQPASRGGGWENFRADVSGTPIKVAARRAATETCRGS